MSVPAWVDREQWPWASREADVGDGTMRYVDVGDGPAVILSHGTPTWGFEWRHVIRGLAHRYRVIVPDHLGFGLSDRPAQAEYTPAAHAARFRRFVDGLALPRFSLVVHDFGGPFALPTALDLADRVDRLVVINSFAWSFDDEPDMRRKGWLAGTWLFRWLYRHLNLSVRFIAPSAWGDRSKLTPAIQAHYLAPWPDPDDRERVLWALAAALSGSSGFYESIWAQREALRALPTAIVWGRKDSAFGPPQLAKWRAALPDAWVTELSDAGHWPHEEDPDRVVAALLARLEGIAGV